MTKESVNANRSKIIDLRVEIFGAILVNLYFSKIWKILSNLFSCVVFWLLFACLYNNNVNQYFSFSY